MIASTLDSAQHARGWTLDSTLGAGHQSDARQHARDLLLGRVLYVIKTTSQESQPPQAMVISMSPSSLFSLFTLFPFSPVLLLPISRHFNLTVPILTDVQQNRQRFNHPQSHPSKKLHGNTIPRAKASSSLSLNGRHIFWTYKLSKVGGGKVVVSYFLWMGTGKTGECKGVDAPRHLRT